ncbi:hypothetical protein NKL07_21995 [Mesorhizobium sp. C280B]|uniref:hypothetical protein n=1 Tax=unclassified Mesorhizobium TaxID=325217 RepID=UPI000409A85D|nr:hypothetical protein [Mesorhizobium sp. LSJC280B00]
MRPHHGRMRGYHSMSLATSIALLLAAIAVVIFVMCGAASSHDAPTGWSYPFSCCSGYDCREVPDDWITESSDGYHIVITGEVIPMTDPKVKQSPDGRFHWCSVAGANDGKTICLFAPPRSF